MKQARFPRARRLHKGYHRRQVDAFLDHIDVALSGALPPPTAAEVRRAGFELVRRGYDTVAVDAALDALEERVLAAQDRAAGRRGKQDPAAEVAFLKEELSAPYMKRFPRAGSWRRGYDIDDVDDFVDKLVVGLEPTGSPVGVEDVRTVPFRPRRGGYREDAVDEMLDRVVELLLVLRTGSAQEDRSDRT
jgi:DivIVA domain-containing protein